MRPNPAVTAVLVATLLLRPAPAATQIQEPPSSDPVPERVLAFTTAFQGAVRAYDVDTWASMVAEDVVMMAPDGRVVEGREAFRELWASSFERASGPNPLNLRIRGTKQTGDMVAVRLDYGPEGSEPVGRYLWVLQESPGGTLELAWWMFTGRG